MIALVLDKELVLREDYPDPRPAPGESLVRVRMAGICGTDLELVRGYMTYRGVPGHEFVGEVIESGDHHLAGRRVVGEINAACGRCDFCRDGLGRHCANRSVLGILDRDGAFAGYLTLPDCNLIPVPDSLTDEAAVFTEPIAAAYEILEQIHPGRDRKILVLGDGRLGAITAIVLRAEGYVPVVAGHHHEKLAQLSLMGLEVVQAEDAVPGFATVIDCTGASDGFNRALELVRPRGTLVLKSTAAADARMNLAMVAVNEITVVGSRCGRFGPALAALESAKIDPLPLISAIYPLDQGLQAISAAAEPPNFKVLLKMY